jgi:hypothetical protein
MEGRRDKRILKKHRRNFLGNNILKKMKTNYILLYFVYTVLGTNFLFIS